MEETIARMHTSDALAEILDVIQVYRPANPVRHWPKPVRGRLRHSAEDCPF